MILRRFWHWLKASDRRQALSAVNARRYRPHIDILEDRCLLAVLAVANTNAAGAGSLAGQVAAAQPGDEIVFDPAVFSSVTSPQTIALAGSLSIGKNLTITGPGANLLTVQGTGASSTIVVGTGTTVTISGLKVTGAGGSGSGIDSAAALTLLNCWVTGNSANVAGGGGIFSDGPSLTVNGCTISGNTTMGSPLLGGGILISGGINTIISSTIFQNNAPGATSDGGGIALTGGGTTSIINCTIAGNTTGHNGGGLLVVSGTVNLVNTIVANNSAAATGQDINGTIATGFNNIVTTAPVAYTITTGSNNQLSATLPASQLENVLRNNGGQTPTLALLGTSPSNIAVGKGTSTPGGAPLASFVDQRDLPRAANAIDVGAFQTESPLVAASTRGTATVFNPDLTPRFNANFANSYGANIEVRVALGDVNGDGVPDLITAAGPGGPSVIFVLDGTTGAPLIVFAAITTGQSGDFIGQSIQFGTNSSGTNLTVGFFVGSGDVNGDGFADVIIGFDGSSSGPLVNVFSGQVIASGQDPAFLAQGILASYNAFPPPGGNVQFNGGVRVAAGDLDGDGRAEVLAVPGIGGGPLVSVYNGLLLTQTNNLNNAAFLISFNAYPIAGWPATGLFVASADVDHDGFRDIILGPGGSGGGQFLLIISGRALLTQFKLTPTQIDSSVVTLPPIALPAVQYAPPYSFPNGIHVATADLNNDGFGDILLGGGPGNGSLLDTFLTNAGGATTQGASANVFGSTLNGIFVAGAPV